ncbi:MAG: hypothetical protein QMB16_06995 [Paracoccaceae bacterium]|jgi:hypothetical protein
MQQIIKIFLALPAILVIGLLFFAIFSDLSPTIQRRILSVSLSEN